MQERVAKTENLIVHWNTETLEVLGTEGVTGAKIRNTKTGEISEITATGFFVAIGHQPNTKIFEGWLDMNESGYLDVVPGRTFTKIPGVFAVGDAADYTYRQAVTAAGTGCMGALDAERYLVESGVI